MSSSSFTRQVKISAISEIYIPDLSGLIYDYARVPEYVYTDLDCEDYNYLDNDNNDHDDDWHNPSWDVLDYIDDVYDNTYITNIIYSYKSINSDKIFY
jgi:hypothetical protein